MHKIIALALCAVISTAIVPATGHLYAQVETGHQEEGANSHKHQAPHGGFLYVIGSCETGHAEILMTDGTMEIWLIGGGTETSRSVRIPDKNVKLLITMEGSAKTAEITLEPSPLELAEETAGDCSHFQGYFPELKGNDVKFKASATITFKGKKIGFVIEYPEGFDKQKP